MVSWPRWGLFGGSSLASCSGGVQGFKGSGATYWSGNPAPGLMEKWSSMRNGLKFFRFGVPMDLRTRAPAPSACSTARKTLRMARGADMFAAWRWVSTAAVSTVVLLLLYRCEVAKLAMSRMRSRKTTTEQMPMTMDTKSGRVFMEGSVVEVLYMHVRHEDALREKMPGALPRRNITNLRARHSRRRSSSGLAPPRDVTNPCVSTATLAEGAIKRPKEA